MASFIRSARAIDMPASHSERVGLVAHGDGSSGDEEEVATSWQRSAKEHRLDPDSSEAPHILTSPQIRQFREPLEHLIITAQEELDKLYRVVREAGYTLLFCDTGGVAVEHRGDDAQAKQFKYWGTWLGGVWAEAIEGTNGIGTCIAEERPVTVHRGQHFRSRHIDLSCSGAPIFGIDGRLLAVLDVSAIDPERSERAHALTGALTEAAARAIEERYFREQFRRQWILAFVSPEDSSAPMLLAVDGNQRICGANRAARTALMFDDRSLDTGMSLWSLFEPNRALFGRNDTTDIPAQLVIAGSGEIRPVLVTPPGRNAGNWRSAASSALHTRPRSDLLAALKPSTPPMQLRGGLPPGAMRRVAEYVASHLGESIELAEMAGVAGLSVYHFARAFKQTAGVTPHSYLVQRRVEQAQQMLARTDLSLAEIALATGFSDQSHFARHFRQMIGLTPGQFRWSLR
jgi:AraC-like DNA-binding protein